MKKTISLKEGNHFYVKNPKGLKGFLQDGSTEIMPQGTTLKITTATQDKVRLSVLDPSGGVLDMTPNQLRRNCAVERRSSPNTTSPDNLSIERQNELLEEGANCPFRGTDTLQGVRNLVMRATGIRLEFVASNFFNPKQG